MWNRFPRLVEGFRSPTRAFQLPENPKTVCFIDFILVCQFYLTPGIADKSEGSGRVGGLLAVKVLNLVESAPAAAQT